MNWQRITEPKAVKLLMQASNRELLIPFMLEPRTVSSVAAQLGLPLNAVHYRVLQMQKIGLLQIVRLQTRAGRGVKYYHSSAQGYFVPFVASGSEGLSGFVHTQLQPYFAHFMDLLAASGASLIQNIEEAGMRLYKVENEVHTDLSPRGHGFDVSEFLDPNAPALMSSFIELRLSRENAKKLQHEMLLLLERYLSPSGSELHLAHVGLVPSQGKFHDD